MTFIEKFFSARDGLKIHYRDYAGDEFLVGIAE
jgi:hypothetical protein